MSVVEGQDFTKKLGLCVRERFDHVTSIVTVEEEL